MKTEDTLSCGKGEATNNLEVLALYNSLAKIFLKC
jgi:hypothetical protein